MYENPKVHIPVINNCPKFRPVSSAIGAPTNKLAKILVPILWPLTVNESTLAEEVSTLCPISWPVLISNVYLPMFLYIGYRHFYWWFFVIPTQFITYIVMGSRKIAPEDNCPHSSKFSSKSVMSELRKTMHCLRVLSFKNHSIKSYFPRLKLKSKKWFTSIYFLQILTKPCRTPLIRENPSVNAFWFSNART